MKTWEILAMLIGVGFAGICLILFARDIINAIIHQFKNTSYEWYTVKVLKQKREWWKWVLAVGAFAIGIYWLLPASLVGQADARAFRQKPEYTAYYTCKYEIAHYGDGTGFAELIKTDSKFTISRLFTDEGFIVLDYACESDEEFDRSIWLSFCSEDDSSICLTGDPVSKEIACTGRDTEVFSYPDASKEYCQMCRECGNGYYIDCMDSSEWMCPNCTESVQTICDICHERCPLWKGSTDEYVICEHCLTNWFKDPDLRCYFRDGEWPEE